MRLFKLAILAALTVLLSGPLFAETPTIDLLKCSHPADGTMYSYLVDPLVKEKTWYGFKRTASGDLKIEKVKIQILKIHDQTDFQHPDSKAGRQLRCTPDDGYLLAGIRFKNGQIIKGARDLKIDGGNGKPVTKATFSFDEKPYTIALHKIDSPKDEDHANEIQLFRPDQKQPEIVGTAGNFFDVLEVGDFNGDGSPDLLLSTSGHESDEVVTLFLSGSDGKLEEAGTYTKATD
jgi:hypothetical protein